MKSTTYKMRAECMRDVGCAIEALAITPNLYGVTVQRCNEFLGDVDVVLQYDGSIDELRNVLATVVDGHVMAETVAHIADYTGER